MADTRTRDAQLPFSELDPSVDQDVVSFIEERWSSRSTRRAGFERQWFTNIAYYLGLQYHDWSRETETLVIPPAPSWRVRLVTNRLIGIARKNVSRILRQKPAWVVIPATNELDDILIARIGSKALKYYWRYLGMDEQLVDLFTWMSVCGNAFLRVYWDTSQGPEMAVTAQDFQRPVMAPEEAPEREEEAQGIFRRLLGFDRRQSLPNRALTRMGDLRVEVMSPFEVDPDPTVTRMRDASHIIHTRTRSLDYMHEQYPGSGEFKGERSSDESLTQHYALRLQTLGIPAGGYSFGSNLSGAQDTVLEHTLYIRANKRQPKGLFVTVAGGRVLRRSELDTQNLPFAHVQEIPVPGRFWGTCALEQCIPLQLEYNRRRSALIENANLMSRPKWFLPKGAGIPETALTSEPGEVVQFNYPFRPDAWHPPEAPGYTVRLLDQTLQDIEDVSAQHEVSNAQVPGGVRSGIAIAQLQEADDTMLAPAILMAEESLSRIGSMALQLLAKYVSEGRLVKIVGRNEEVETLTFKGSQLQGANSAKPGVNYFDVEVQMGSQLPQSKAARIQFVLDLVQYGILDRQVDRERIFEILQIGSEEPTLSEVQLDRSAVYRENIDLLAGARLPINPWDSDEVHIRLHRQEEKTADFQRRLFEDPDLAARFEEHIESHLARFQAQAEPQVQMPPEAEVPIEPIPEIETEESALPMVEQAVVPEEF